MRRNTPPSRLLERSATGELSEAEQSAARRRWSTEVLSLHAICHQRACRRARRCAREDAPCIIRYKPYYQEYLPAIHKALMARLPE